MATPHRCPVCNGVGTVPVGFYGDQGADASRPTCKACGGSGMVWDWSNPPAYTPPQTDTHIPVPSWLKPHKINYGPTWGYVPTQATGLMFN